MLLRLAHVNILYVYVGVYVCTYVCRYVFVTHATQKFYQCLQICMNYFIEKNLANIYEHTDI